MEERKLQETGHGTLIVSLPKKWIKLNKLHKGDIVIVTYYKDYLIISIPKSEKLQTTIKFLDIETTFREIVSKYIQGFDKIHLVASSSQWKELKKVREYILKKLPGVEVTDTENGILIEIVASTENYGIERIIERINSNLRWMILSIKQALETKDIELLKEVCEKDDEIDRLNLLANRYIFSILKNPEFFKLREKIIYFKIILDKFESIGDSIESLARNLIFVVQNKNLPMKKFSKVLTLMEKLISDVIKAFFNLDKQLANEIIFRGNNFSKIALSQLRNISISENFVIAVENLSHIGQLCKEAGEAIIDFV
ncbi:MAG TPA: phosphate uptake regulator PhoU [Nanoarchaeota archaeon]|nr:phosphate uptake regulator PhoU [Nanoarchaeota archaeon]